MSQKNENSQGALLELGLQSYQELLTAENFVEQFVKNNKKLHYENRVRMMDYVRKHPGIWNYPSDVESVMEMNQRIVIKHRHGEVFMSMPAQDRAA